MKLLAVAIFASCAFAQQVQFTPSDENAGRYWKYSLLVCAGTAPVSYTPATLMAEAARQKIAMATNAGLLEAYKNKARKSPQRIALVALEIGSYVYTAVDMSGLVRIKEKWKTGISLVGPVVRFATTAYPQQRDTPSTDAFPSHIEAQAGQCVESWMWGSPVP